MQTNASLPPLTYNDTTGHFHNKAGDAVILRGVNLGNWFLLEPWMLALDSNDYRDQHDILMTLRQRFGDTEARRLMDVYRANWITARELKHAKAFGFNVVRLPFHYQLLLEYERPYEMREDPFRWLDHAIDLCQQAGLYVILDLHGAPGGQSHDMPSGRVGENNLWTDEIAQQRTADLWRAVAKRYADHPAVVGYDLVNEPWGDFQQDLREDIVQLVDLLYAAVREVDKDTVIYAPGLLNGFLFYGDPRSRGWMNTGFTIHTYPGLFGNGDPTLDTHERFFTHYMEPLRPTLDRWRVPMLIGEFNPVFREVDRPNMLRHHFDTFASYGWHATVWSLRKINPEGMINESDWCLIANAEPYRIPDLKTASAAQIEQAFKQLGTQQIDVDRHLTNNPLALATISADNEPVAEPVWQISTEIQGWSGHDIGLTGKGTVRRDSEQTTLLATGQDIWGNADEFYFLQRDNPVDADFVHAVTLTGFDAPGRYAKAGIMLRSDNTPGSAHVLLHAFPNGRIILAHRPQANGPTRERLLAIREFPIELAMRKTNGRVEVRIDNDGPWLPAPTANLTQQPHIGLAVSSNAEAGRATATFANHTSDQTTSDPSQQNLFPNGPLTPASEWGTWGSGASADETAKALHFDHTRSTDSVGLFRDAQNLTPGGRVRLAATADVPAGLRGTLELRVEALNHPAGHPLTSASVTYDLEELAALNGPQRLHIEGPIPTDGARVLFIATVEAGQRLTLTNVSALHRLATGQR
ncbi:glycoside hydrolase family 5 protein [Mucisphaera sp.]|uniref:glycoside hydrolase family 5 protein n=1 Tax=Mucisphaera sp. TaxID=2913024 RepID=UPI003D145DC4